MRVLLNVGFADNKKIERNFPINYREEIGNFLKECFEKSNKDLIEFIWDKYDKYLEKPFTFSVNLPNYSDAGDQVNFISDHFIINFSFGCYSNDETEHNLLDYDYKIFTNIYNDVVKSKKNFMLDFTDINNKKYQVVLNDAIVKMDRIKIDDKPQSFKTLSPILINKSENNDSPQWITPDNSHYSEYLKNSIKELSSKYIGVKDFNFIFQPLKFEKVEILYDNKTLSGFSGKFNLFAPPPVKKLIYEIGVGVKRSEGFGMIETL